MDDDTTVDMTIVVRVWREPHDREVRSRLVVVGSDEAVTARGVSEIERALRSLIARFNAAH